MQLGMELWSVDGMNGQIIIYGEMFLMYSVNLFFFYSVQ